MKKLSGFELAIVLSLLFELIDDMEQLLNLNNLTIEERDKATEIYEGARSAMDKMSYGDEFIEQFLRVVKRNN